MNSNCISPVFAVHAGTKMTGGLERCLSTGIADSLMLNDKSMNIQMSDALPTKIAGTYRAAAEKKYSGSIESQSFFRLFFRIR